MIITNIRENKKCSKPPTRTVFLPHLPGEGLEILGVAEPPPSPPAAPGSARKNCESQIWAGTAGPQMRVQDVR